MQSTVVVRESPIVRSARVMQLEGMFDLRADTLSRIELSLEAFQLPDEWQIGLIVGPSGSGKTSIAQHLYSSQYCPEFVWNSKSSIVDEFPKEMSIKDICGLLSHVGFSSPPSWLRPFHALSNGEQFRVALARALAEFNGLLVMDEFTSVVDRTVAQIGSAAIAKTVRRRKQQLIAVSCHYDIAEWLCPDWIFDTGKMSMVETRCLQRPDINLRVERCNSEAWKLFRQHHYLNTNLNRSARCFLARYNERPVAFVAVLPFPHAKRPGWREHRLVCLPDFQGVGIGNAVSDYVASLYILKGRPYFSLTSHPGVTQSRSRSLSWKMVRNVSRSRPSGGTSQIKGLRRTIASRKFGLIK